MKFNYKISLLEDNDILVKENYAFFWGSPFSNWYAASFVDNHTYFATSEHYMMYEKAKLFNDVEIMKQILKTNSPAKAKKLGKKVKNYDDDIWAKYRYMAVLNACYLKFEQNVECRKLLIESYPLHIVEASSYDKIWGIGMGVDDPDITIESKWKGKNLLGKVLMDVRTILLKGRNDYV